MPKGGKTGQQSGKATNTATENTEANGANACANASKSPSQNTDEAVETTNHEILEAIRAMHENSEKQYADLLEGIKGIKGDIQAQSQRIGEAEERISTVEDDIIALQEKVDQLEQTMKVLSHKVQDHEDRERRSNVRLVGLPEKVEGADMCAFLERWLKVALGDSFTSTPVVERAHRIGPLNPKSAAPRVVIMKFLSYRDREITLQAARKMKKVQYEDKHVSLFPDLSPETRKMQRCFDGVKGKLRALNIRYGVLYPAHLIITHNEKRTVFRSAAEAEDYIKQITPQPAPDA